MSLITSLPLNRIYVVFVLAGGVCAATTSNTTLQDFLIVSLDGRNTTQFFEVQTDFQELIATIATAFCDSSGFTNYGVINSSTVKINRVEACPAEWPNAGLCINVNFSVPIANSSSYELSSRHLASLWRTHTMLQLTALGLKEYDLPSNTTILILWLSVTGVLFLLFLLILVLVVKTKFIENYIRGRRDMLGASNRSWLNHHNTKQLVPPFFYPEPPSDKHSQPHESQYDVSGRHRMFGIENPGYDPERKVKSQLGNQISVSTVMVDDFDSDEETIYPPSPLPRLTQQRNGRGTDVAVTQEELETAF